MNIKQALAILDHIQPPTVAGFSRRDWGAVDVAIETIRKALVSDEEPATSGENAPPAPPPEAD